MIAQPITNDSPKHISYNKHARTNKVIRVIWKQFLQLPSYLTAKLSHTAFQSVADAKFVKIRLWPDVKEDTIYGI